MDICNANTIVLIKLKCSITKTNKKIYFLSLKYKTLSALEKLKKSTKKEMLADLEQRNPFIVSK